MVGVTSFYLYDGLGSVRALADRNGVVSDRYIYDAYGNLISVSGSSANNYRFTGEQLDTATGDYYLRDRYYSSHIGRFTRADVFEGRFNDPLSLHKYLYTHGNPVNAIDPSGLYRLVLRYRGTGNTHTDIVAIDKNGANFYWAGAENQGSSDQASGTSSGSSSTGFGFIITHSAFSPDPSEDPGVCDCQVILDSNNPNDTFPISIKSSILGTLAQVEASHIKYNFLSRNSNSVAFTALEKALKFRPVPYRNAPGWDIDVFTGKPTFAKKNIASIENIVRAVYSVELFSYSYASSLLSF